MSDETPLPLCAGDRSEMRMQRILVVEDHPIVREGYAQLIGNQPDLQVCGFAASEQEALAQIKIASPSLIVIDLTLKNGHGIDLIKQVKHLYPKMKMLVISAHDENVFAERALDAGALGYINKQEAAEHLVDGIRQVLRGEIYLSEAMTQRLLKGRLSKTTDAVRPLVDCLSDRELQVFQWLGQGQTTKRIAAEMYLSPKTIERYRENIKNKLQLRNATELVQRATQWVLENR